MLNIPVVSHSTLDARQRESGKTIETIANFSMQESIEEELRVVKEKTGKDDLVASVDAGWQKRGSGKSYDSLSGHCSMIGEETGKIIGYAVRSKQCKKCQQLVTSECESIKEHDCRKYFSGTAKSMEQDMVAEMITESRKKGINMNTIVGEEDTTIISRLRRTNIDQNFMKKSDKNHIRKLLGNMLHTMRTRHKSLTIKVIKYLKKYFNYMIACNQGDPDEISHGLIALSNHPFEDHENCSEKWCRFLKNPQMKFKNLPYRQPLSDSVLQQSLAQLFLSFQKHSDKISDLGSTQANESFNKTVASKAPKDHHYSSSASLNYRVAASVAQKNLGHKYLIQVNKKLGLSPGIITSKISTLRDLQSRKRKAISITRKAKLRRIELKAKRHQDEASKEVRYEKELHMKHL